MKKIGYIQTTSKLQIEEQSELLISNGCSKIYVETSNDLNYQSKQKLQSANHFVLMIDKFCNQINKNEKRINFEKDLIIQAKILEAARISAKKNRIIKLSEIL